MRQIQFPPEWTQPGARPVDIHEPKLVRDHAGGECVLTGALLDDGTNMMAVVWGGGQRYARVAASTDWGIEERYEGRLTGRHRQVVEKVWREVIESMVQAGRQVRELRESDPEAFNREAKRAIAEVSRSPIGKALAWLRGRSN